MDSYSYAVFNWSGGKDSALALYRVLQDPTLKINSLLTTLNAANRRVSMHGVQEVLLQKQADALGIDLHKVLLPENASMEKYQEVVTKAFTRLREEAVAHSIFGDIFLEDLRAYREAQMEKLGMKAHFPLWQSNTADLLNEFLSLGFRTIVVSVNEEVLDKSFCGRIIDRDFLRDLPANVDPCGENGEFHSFVFDGPIFREAVEFQAGEKVYRTYPSPVKAKEEVGFWFCELHPKN